jgi:NAD(P)H-dependent FMN reductase
VSGHPAQRNIVCISGTNRPDNYSARALAVITAELQRLGETFTVFDARELELPFPGHPGTDDARRLVAAVEAASGIIMVSPEYHGGISAHTKLVIENLGFPSKLAGKPVALAGVAAGRIGAIKSLEQIKGILSHVGALVVPGAVSVAGVRSVFDDEGNCLDESVAQALQGVAGAMQHFLNDFVCPKLRLEEMVRQDGPAWVTSL